MKAISQAKNDENSEKISVHAWAKESEVIQMTEPKQKPVNDLPIFGRDIEDDWSWDREEEELRESNESDED